MAAKDKIAESIRTPVFIGSAARVDILMRVKHFLPDSQNLYGDEDTTAVEIQKNYDSIIPWLVVSPLLSSTN